MQNSSFLAAKNRYKEKKLNELQEIVELQNEEILRLKNEQKQVFEQIAHAEAAGSKADIILKRRIAALQSEIKNIDSRHSILKSHSSQAHSKMIGELQSEHQDKIIKLRIEYETKIAELSLQNSKPPPTSDIFAEIDTSKADIASALKEKMTNNEKQVQKELLQLDSKIKDLAQYHKELEDKVKLRKNLINEENDKFKNYIEKSNELQKRRTNAIEEAQKSIEEQYNMFVKAQLAEENALREKNNEIIEKIRQKISEQRIRTSKMKESIATGRTDTSFKVDEAKQEKIKLTSELDKQIYSTYTDGEKSMIKVVKKEYVDRQYLIKRLAAYKEQMNEIKKQRNEVLTEVKRLDFMLYGKNGKYQRKK